jgi:hypothetical protein
MRRFANSVRPRSAIPLYFPGADVRIDALAEAGMKKPRAIANATRTSNSGMAFSQRRDTRHTRDTRHIRRVTLGTPVVTLTSFPSRRCIRHGAPPGCSWLDEREPSEPPKDLSARLSISPMLAAEWRARTKTPKPKAVATPPL